MLIDILSSMNSSVNIKTRDTNLGLSLGVDEWTVLEPV